MLGVEGMTKTEKPLHCSLEVLSFVYLVVTTGFLILCDLLITRETDRKRWEKCCFFSLLFLVFIFWNGKENETSVKYAPGTLESVVFTSSVFISPQIPYGWVDCLWRDGPALLSTSYLPKQWLGLQIGVTQASTWANLVTKWQASVLTCNCLSCSSKNIGQEVEDRNN